MRRANTRVTVLAMIIGLLLIVGALAGCGSGASTAGCHVAPGQGYPGVCAPSSVKQTLSKPTTVNISQFPKFPDVSNNDPISCSTYGLFKSREFPAVWLKAIEGTGFIDSTFSTQSFCAHHFGLATGGYDFYEGERGETSLFIKVLRDNNECGNRNTLPPALDIELGGPYLHSVIQDDVNQIYYACGHRVAIYTGAWYWNDHEGFWWPTLPGTNKQVPGWVSGYPVAPLPSGLKTITVHQYTDRGVFGDQNIFVTGSFNVFINNVPIVKPKPKPKPVSNAVKIKELNKNLSALEKLAAKHSCHTKAGARKDHACGVWGAQAHIDRTQIKKYEEVK